MATWSVRPLSWLPTWGWKSKAQKFHLIPGLHQGAWASGGQWEVEVGALEVTSHAASEIQSFFKK